jgi:hypothetical protein
MFELLYRDFKIDPVALLRAAILGAIAVLNKLICKK